MARAIVWFRNDLRLDDNPALQAALDEGYAPVPVYVHAPEEESPWAPGAASEAWRHRSLAALESDLQRRGSTLLYRRGPTAEALGALIEDSGAEAVFWNRRYEPAIERRDAGLKSALRERGLRAQSFNGALLFEPWRLATQQGGPYKVFTPYWRAAQAQWRLPALWEAPLRLPAVPESLAGASLSSLGLQPHLRWDAGFWEVWQPGEGGAGEALEVFIDGALADYHRERDLPDRTGTSRLSPHLHFGEIAPWRIAAELEKARSARTGADIDAYLRQLGWRDFAHHLLHHFPQTPQDNLNPRFERFAWAEPDLATLSAWERGRTGVPIVDAGMRELWTTGHMHNRVRMIVASYLTKHLRYHWSHGAR